MLAKTWKLSGVVCCWFVFAVRAADIYIIHLGTQSTTSEGYFSAQPSVDFAVELVNNDANILEDHTVHVLYSDVEEVCLRTLCIT